MPKLAVHPIVTDTPLRAPLVAPRWIAGGGAIDSPVRDLHDRLIGAFGETMAPVPVHRGLPLIVRATVIVGAAALLWSGIIVGAVYAL